jgi:DNA end-binding protein Ku
MVFPDEIIDPEAIDEIAAADDVEVNERELAIAEQLVESLAAQFDPDKFRDTYRDDVLALVERKAAGEQIAVQPAADEEEVPVPDLMSALKASLDAVRAREGNGGQAAASKPAAKRKAAAAKASSSSSSSSDDDDDDEQEPAGKKAPAKKAPAGKAVAKKPAAGKKPTASKR